ncbi:MAG: alpha/beta fold hydrolase [Ardenticatenaceae bacterium]|nr:alpha/beta fold hydrolase [Ardenticatenaceae bacterium]
MLRIFRNFVLLSMIILVFAACSGGQTENESDPETAVVEETESPQTVDPEPEPADVPEESADPTIEESVANEDAGVQEESESDPAPVTEQNREFVEGSCPFTIPVDADVTCGTVEVPQNRQNPADGGTVSLAVAIFSSSTAEPAADPVVYLAGGPGGFALELIEFTFEDSIQPYLADRDYVIFDQRGTGYSEPSLVCSETFELDLDLLDDDLEDGRYNELYLDALGECRQRLLDNGVDLSAYNSAENAADVEDLRQALGYDSWNLLGVSYGTRLAQTVMRDFPQGVRSVILDSPYPLEADLQEAIPGHMTRGFRVFFDGCAADPACAAAYPDLEGTFYSLVDTLNENPIEFPIIYFFTGEEYDVIFNGDDLIDILFQSLYSNEIFPLLPRVITEVDEGEYETLSLLFTTFLINGEFISTGMYRSVQCHEELAFSDLAAVESASLANDQLADYFSDWELAYDACDLWQNGSADPIENQPVASDIPTLVLTGEYDPITPPSWGDDVADNLTNEILISFPGIGHGATSSADCPLNISLAFLNDPAGSIDESCVSTMEPPPFDAPPLPGEVVEAEEIVLVPFEVEVGPGTTIAGSYPDGWDESSPGIYLRGRDVLDQAGIIFQAFPPGSFSGEELAGLFTDQLSADSPDDPEVYLDSQSRSWDVYQSKVQTAPLFIGVTTDDDGNLLAVVFIMNSGEEEELRGTVFEPVMDALILQ